MDNLKISHLDPMKVIANIDKIEEVLLLAVITGSAEEFDYKGYHVSADDFRHLSALSTSELLGRLEFDDSMFNSFLADVKSDNPDLFERYWNKFGDLVKKESQK